MVQFFFSPDEGAITLPAVRASPRIRGSNASSVTFSFMTDGWVGVRYGVSQGRGEESVAWLCVDASGVVDGSLPNLPMGVGLSDLGFDTAAGAEAFLVPVHRLGGTVTDTLGGAHVRPNTASVEPVRALVSM